MENSIKEKIDFETALSYAGVSLEDVIECDKGDDAYHFIYKKHINVDKFNIADIENKEIKIEESSIFMFPFGIGVVTDIMYGKPDNRTLGGFFYTDIIKETKEYTIDFLNRENIEYEERTFYNGSLFEENKKKYNVPDNFSLSDGVSELKEVPIKNKLIEEIKSSIDIDFNEKILDKTLAGFTAGEGFYDKKNKHGHYKIIFNENGEYFELGVSDTSHIGNNSSITNTISIESDKCLAFFSEKENGITCSASILSSNGYYVIMHDSLNRDKHILKYYSIEQYMQMYEQMKKNPNNFRFGLIYYLNSFEQNISRGCNVRMNLEPTIITLENDNITLDVCNLLIQNDTEKALNIINDTKNITKK